MSYELLLFVHVLSAIVWVGSVVTVQAVAMNMQRANDSASMIRFMRSAQILSKVIGPAILLLIAAGVLLVEKLGISYLTTWVLIGLIGFVASLTIGGFMAGQEGKRLDALFEEQGPDGAGVAASMKRLVTIAGIDMVILLVVVWAMTWKPGA